MHEPHEEHRLDDAGNPAGGVTMGVGFGITWQDGPVDPESGANGAQVEEIIEACMGRLRFLNEASNGKFRCRENSCAITHLDEAAHWLFARTRTREMRGVEGTHTP